MSSNVGLPTPRGSGTSGYVQRNLSFLKPRNAGYGAPYPPVSVNGGDSKKGESFKQRKPDKQILEHDRRRAIEVKVLEERERLEEENERIEEELKKQKKSKGDKDRVPLSEEEIEERCNALRQKLLKELEDELAGRHNLDDDEVRYDRRRGRGDPGPPPRERRQFKSYQVHELAEAKMEETERLRKALGIKEDWEKEGDLYNQDRKNRDKERDREREREKERDRERY
ncbi:hypothetical protein VTN96DRAFT_3369 [Rasamsonia emersonii]|uniref:RNA binding protein n=1 Tax=Rasamsonia emersonii (strain ATCC 16479 / CBS 393.64 / IMI 116815) TaxID=1408163 RepID=A0A0F4YM73_RASE3|nr:RNA binding protein [Rasamsonia emersonii CBS 393.64]KKA18713.1 RNA binding protein [Rasamsonia emersonii CBS 393.64]